MIEAFLNFGPLLKGESQALGRAGWVDIDSWEFEVSQHQKERGTDAGGKGAVQAGTTGGMKPTFTAVRIKKEMDRASPNLMAACATGRVFKEVVLEQCKAGASVASDRIAAPFLRVVLGNVQVSEYQADSGNDHPADDFRLSFQKIHFSYREQTGDGALGVAVSVDYDLQKGDPEKGR